MQKEEQNIKKVQDSPKNKFTKHGYNISVCEIDA